MERCTEIWRERVFDLLLREEKSDEDVVRSMRQWPHSAFSMDNSVQITSEDTKGVQRLISYISRCTFSLARIKFTEDGQVISGPGKTNAYGFRSPDRTGDSSGAAAGLGHLSKRFQFLQLGCTRSRRLRDGYPAPICAQQKSAGRSKSLQHANADPII